MSEQQSTSVIQDEMKSLQHNKVTLNEDSAKKLPMRLSQPMSTNQQDAARETPNNDQNVNEDNHTIHTLLEKLGSNARGDESDKQSIVKQEFNL